MSEVRFVLGAMSPYSWFAAERIETLIPAAAWHPVFAGGLFATRGRPSWGLTDERPAKQADCEARAERHGLGPITWPDPWPTNDVHVARAMVAAEEHGRLQRYAVTAMRMAFREGADLGDVTKVLEAGERIALDPALLGARMADARVKARLRELTDAASALGVDGVPTVLVGGDRFWGDDRLEEAAAAARR